MKLTLGPSQMKKFGGRVKIKSCVNGLNLSSFVSKLVLTRALFANNEIL